MQTIRMFTTDSFTFYYNENFEGDITIECHQISDGAATMRIPGADLLQFVADAYVRPKMISAIEQTPASDLLMNQLIIEGENP